MQAEHPQRDGGAEDQAHAGGSPPVGKGEPAQGVEGEERQDAPGDQEARADEQQWRHAGESLLGEDPAGGGQQGDQQQQEVGAQRRACRVNGRHRSPRRGEIGRIC